MLESKVPPNLGQKAETRPPNKAHTPLTPHLGGPRPPIVPPRGRASTWLLAGPTSPTLHGPLTVRRARGLGNFLPSPPPTFNQNRWEDWQRRPQRAL